jgi:hypothetical protein
LSQFKHDLGLSFPAGLGLRIIDVSAPIALHDLDDTILKIDVGPRQPQDFGDARALAESIRAQRLEVS